MNKHAIEVNGRWFVVYTHTLEDAIRAATAHMASIMGVQSIGESRTLTRWENT